MLTAAPHKITTVRIWMSGMNSAMPISTTLAPTVRMPVRAWWLGSNLLLSGRRVRIPGEWVPDEEEDKSRRDAERPDDSRCIPARRPQRQNQPRNKRAKY
jgi:hypothetical protein